MRGEGKNNKEGQYIQDKKEGKEGYASLGPPINRISTAIKDIFCLRADANIHYGRYA